jgi:hypothetical protein
MPGKLNLKINQGETFKHTLKWLDANEQPINNTGYSGKMHIRAKVDTATTLLTFSSNPADTPNGTITFGGADGSIVLYLSAAATSAIDWLSGVYDLEITDSLGDITRLVEGKVTVTKEVTR